MSMFNKLYIISILSVIWFKNNKIKVVMSLQSFTYGTRNTSMCDYGHVEKVIFERDYPLTHLQES